MLSCDAVARSILLPAVELVMCLSWIEAAGDESVLNGFAGMSSAFQCASLASCPLTPFLLCHGARLPVKHRSRAGLGLRRQTADLQISKAVCPCCCLVFFTDQTDVATILKHLCCMTEEMGLKREAGVLIMLTSEVFWRWEEPQPGKTLAAKCAVPGTEKLLDSSLHSGPFLMLACSYAHGIAKERSELCSRSAYSQRKLF